MTIKAKPFIKWVGGKSQLLESIGNNLPDDFIRQDNLTYIEPFAGGGAMLFHLLQHYPNIRKAVINDINPDLATTYRVVRQSPEILLEKLEKIQKEYLPLNDEKRKIFFLEKREQYNLKLSDETEHTALFLFLNRTCFNGLYRVNSKGHFNVPFGRYVNPKICDRQTIMADSQLLQKVEILTGDFEATLNHATPGSFFYFDPPYRPLSETSSFNSYAKEGFNDDEQIRLSRFCHKIHALGHRFVLSNSDPKGVNPTDNFFEQLYKGFHIQSVQATRMINSNATKRGKLSEQLITNFL